MKIKKNKECFYTTYEKLDEGAAFKIDDYENDIFMKVDDELGVCLNDTEIVYFDKNDAVKELKAVLQIMED